MKTKLTLQEKLCDLRDEHRLKLLDVSEATGIPLATLQRLESIDDILTGYQDIATLAKFYGVSTDYLFGVTDNRQHRNIDVDKLCLSDEAISVLSSKKLNNRIISELISYPDFLEISASMEVYIDRKISTQSIAVYGIYKLAENLVKDNSKINENDIFITFLKDSIVDDEEYLLFVLHSILIMLLEIYIMSIKKTPELWKVRML